MNQKLQYIKGTLTTLALILSLSATPVVVCANDKGNDKFLVASHFPKDTTVLGKWLDLIYSDAFRRIGKSMKYIHYPYKRGDTLINNGEVDAVLARPMSYARLNPQLIPIKEAAPTDKLSAFAQGNDIEIDGWDGLKNYRVAYPRGFVLAEINLKRIGNTDKVYPINKPIQALKMLDSNRVDIFLAPQSNFVQLLSMRENAMYGVHKVGVVQEVPLHAFLSSSNADLATDLEKALKAMKAEGVINKYLIMSLEFTQMSSLEQ